MTHARNQDGFALIEVIVSAAVLAIVALAVLAGIDGATASTARERARAVASSLAEQDQERLRSFRFDELTQLVSLPPEKRTRPVTVGGVTYSVLTEVTLIVDSGVPNSGCGAGGKSQSEYIRIVSTVTSAIVGDKKRVAPVKLESLVAPPVSGSLVVKVTDIKGLPVNGVTVTAIAKSLRQYQGTTNTDGCALFTAIESGDFTIKLDKEGYVGDNGKPTAEGATTVSPNLVNLYPMTYTRAGRVNVSIRTLRPGTAFSTSATWFPSKAADVSDSSADPSSTRFYTPAQPASMITVGDLYPFASGYSFFTGSCAIQNPSRTTGNKEYFSQVNKSAVVVVDADKAPQAATVYQPALNLRIVENSKDRTTFDPTTIRVKAYVQKLGSESCSNYQGTELALMSWPSNWGAAPGNQTNYWLTQKGTEFDPGFPFGSYQICFEDTDNSPRRWLSTIYDNTKASNGTTSALGATGWSSSKPSGC